MTIAAGVSFLGQSNMQILRMRDLRLTFDDLQRQVTTQKKYENLTGFGLDTQRVLQLHAERDQFETFNRNIDTAMSRVSLMDNSLTRIGNAMREMMDAVRLQPSGGAFDMENINTRATQLLDLVVDLTNITFGGRYLFSGTDSQNAPLPDKNAMLANIQTEITDWLDGVNTTAQTISNTDGFIPTELGFSTTVSSAVEVSVRIDRGLEVTYGALADRSGVQDVVRAMGMLARLQQPDPATDVPTNADFTDLVDHIMSVAQNGIESLENARISLNGKLDLLKNVQETHQEDINLYNSLIDTAENVDVTEAIASLQAVETQLRASYEVARLVSQISLVNFLS